MVRYFGVVVQIAVDVYGRMGLGAEKISETYRKLKLTGKLNVVWGTSAKRC